MPDDNITEHPAGPNDAERILRFALREAENGRLDDVVLICGKGKNTKDNNKIWSYWSDMARNDILWMARWLMKYIDARYFPTADGED